MDEKTFEDTWHKQIVRPKSKKYKVTDTEYFVTAALKQKDEVIFAIKALNYTLENKNWITIHLTLEDADQLGDHFDILRDGWEECKPRIVNEILWSFEDKGDEYEARISSYIFEEQCGTEIIPKSKMSRMPAADEYMFLYDFKGGDQLEAKPACYIIPLPPFEYREEVENFVAPFREDVLKGLVMFGMNKRILGGLAPK